MIFYLNIIFSTVNSLLLLFFFHSLSFLAFKNFKLVFSKNFFYIFCIFIIISIFSLLFQLILIFDFKFFYEQKINIKIITLFVIYINFFNFLIKNEFSSVFKNFYFLKKKNWISIFLFLVFICSLGIVNDADSLIYHSKISKIILSGFKVNFFYDNPHNLLIGTYELFNILPEILKVSNFNTLLNFYVLFFFIKFIYEKFNKKNFNLDLFILLIISVPVITIILTPQKSFFVPLIIQFLTFLFILYNKKFIKEEYMIIISALIITTTFKLNFILSAVLILISFFIKAKNLLLFKTIFKISLVISLIYLIPHFIFKTIYFETPFPPFLNKFLNIYPGENMFELFSNELKEWKKNSIHFPLGLFLNYYNGSFSSIHNSLGIGFISFFFIKMINYKNFKVIIFFLIFMTFLNFLFVQETPRFYFLPYLISLLIIFDSKIRNLNFLKKIIFIQYIFTVIALCFLVPISFSTTFINAENDSFKNKFIFRYAAYQKINQIVGKNKFIVVDVPNYYSNNYEISTMILNYISNDDELYKYKRFLDENDVSYFFSVNTTIEKNIFKNRNGREFENFFSKCFKELIDKFSYEESNRKKILFDTKDKITYYVYKKTKGCKFS